MSVLFLCYPGCSTCAKARNWLEEHQIAYTERNIKAQNPTAAELEEWISKSGLDSARFFNTSGMRYRELALKDKLPAMSLQERISLLATDGMLVRRPLLIGDSFVLVGFKAPQWEEALAIQ